MPTIQELREKIANLAKQANHLLNENGDKKWAAEDQTKFDNLTNEINQLKGQIKNIETMRELETENFLGSSAAKKEDGVVDNTAIVRLYLRNGLSNLTPEQAVQVRNAMSTTTGTEGGFTVPKEISTLVIEMMKAYGGMREVAEILATDSGADFSFPTTDGTGEEGEIVDQNADAGNQDIVFGTAALPTFMYSSKFIALPWQLVTDSGIDIIALVIRRQAERIARIQNKHFTIGGGTTVPDGVIPRAGLGKTGATGNTLTATYDDVIDLKHSVNRAYRRNARFMMNDLSVATFSKLKDDNGRPIWVPSVEADAPDVLAGYRVVVNDDVPVMAANARSLAFGDFSQYKIRDVKNSTIIRRFDDSKFAGKGQVGFNGWHRSGGNLVDAGAVKVYRNSAT